MSEQAKEQHSLSTLTPHIVSGSAWMIGMRWALRGIGLVNTIILARLLTPDDFGVIAMAMIAVGFLQTMAEANVDIAILRNQDAKDDHFHTAWTIKVISGIAITCVLYLLAPHLANYYGDARVEIIIYVTALRALIVGFENIGVVEFRRNLDFSKEFRYYLFRRSSLFILTLLLALYFRDYRALVISVPVSALILVGLSYYMSSFRPHFCLKQWGELWSFSKWQILTNISKFCAERGDQFIVGGISNATLTGSYYIASDVSATPSKEVVQPIGRVMVPIYSKLAHDPQELRQAFKRIFGFIAIISMSTGFGLSAVSNDFVHAILGQQWAATIPIFEWLALYGPLIGIIFGVTPYLQVCHKEKALGLSYIGYVAILIPTMIYFGSAYGIVEIAISRNCVTLGFACWILVYLSRCSVLTLGDITAVLWRPILASIAMYFTVAYFHNSVFSLPIASLFFDILLGSITFPLYLLCLWLIAQKPFGPETLILERLARQLKIFFGATSPPPL